MARIVGGMSTHSALKVPLVAAALTLGSPAIAWAQLNSGLPDKSARIVVAAPIDIPNIVSKAALYRHAFGIAMLAVELAPDGTLLRTTVVRSSGNKWLDLSAMTAVRHCRFEAERRGGVAVGGTYQVIADFDPS
jgi:TonB family protein